MRQCCLCEADWEELHWSLFHCGSCFPSRVFASMMIEQSKPDHCRKRSSSLRPARVRKGGGSHRVRGCMLTTRSFQHVSCAGQPAAMQVTAMPPDVSKAQAWMLWKFFHHLMLGRIHRKTNMEPENVLWEKETSLQTIHFRIPCWFLVFLNQGPTPLTLEALENYR